MAVGAKFINVVPESVDNAIEFPSKSVKQFLFKGAYISEIVGKKFEYEGYIYLCLQGVTGGTTLGGDIAMAVIRPIRPATGDPEYRLVSYTEMTLNYSDVVIFLRDGDFKVVHRDDCGLI